LTPEQQAKQKRWKQAEENMKTARRNVGRLDYMRVWSGRTESSFEEQEQLAHDEFINAEKEYNQALAEFKSSLRDQVSKK
jgi:hypothetical protein